jgi:hypothetical protein
MDRDVLNAIVIVGLVIVLVFIALVMVLSFL